jgi:hypothetical protein
VVNFSDGHQAYEHDNGIFCTSVMGGIFISYRRTDSPGETGRLFDELASAFGADRVYLDVASIEPGRDFRRVIDEALSKCAALLAVIGPNWLNVTSESGARRLDEPTDLVRVETASALKRGIPVVPVLVRGAQMPAASQLPAELKDLAFRNCVELTHVRWKSDVQLLVNALHALIDPTDLGEQPRSSEAAPRQVSQNEHSLVDPAMVQRVTRELAVYIGQIAGFVVKRAAEQCPSAEELYLKVAEEIDSHADRTQFLRNRALP